MATQSSYKGYFYHEPNELVQREIRSREFAYSTPERGIQVKGNTYGIKFPYMKTAYADVYEYCPITENNPVPIVSALMGSGLALSKKSFDGNARKGLAKKIGADKAGGELWTTQGHRVLRPTLPLLQSVNISSEGRVGSLQNVTINFKLWDVEQLDQYEKKIMQPGKDVLVQYGWSTSTIPTPESILKRNQKQKVQQSGKGSSSPPVTDGSNVGNTLETNHDVFTGIVSNFSWKLNSDLSYDCDVTLTGQGFLASGMAANAPQDKSKKVEEIEDEGGVKIFVDNLVSKIQADVEQLNKKIGNSSTPKIYEANSANVPMKYGVLELKYNESEEETIKTDESGNPTNGTIPKEAEGKESKIFYIPLKDILKYFDVQVLSQSPRTNSNDVKNAQLYLSGDPIEQVHYLVDGAQSISLYDPNICSADPATVLFNGGRDGGNKHSANYSDNFSSGNYKTGNYRIHGEGDLHAEFQFYDTSIVSDGCDLGNILISTNFIEESLKDVSNEKDPVEKGIMAFCDKLFSKIAWCSGDIYQLTFVEMKSTSGGTWNVVVDKNYIPGENVEPFKFYVTVPERAIIRNINMSSKIPNGMQTALYVGGRAEVTDGNFSSAGKIVDDGCDLHKGKNPPPNNQQNNTQNNAGQRGEEVDKPPYVQLNECKAQLAKVGSIHFTRQQLNQVLKKFKSDGFRTDGGSERYKFMRRDLYPINLSFELDGIVGFTFGDAISIDDVLPQRYKDTKVVFIITKISHSISPNVWTTTIEVQCRPDQS